MSGLRIMFEVDEKHVGACLVALEGRAKNLNFEVIAEVDWQKNRPSGRGPDKVQRKSNGHQKLTAETVLGFFKNYPSGLDKKTMLELTRAAGAKTQGLHSILLSLVKKKILKKVGSAWGLASVAKGSAS
jgi:hypothetical protein